MCVRSAPECVSFLLVFAPKCFYMRREKKIANARSISCSLDCKIVLEVRIWREQKKKKQFHQSNFIYTIWSHICNVNQSKWVMLMMDVSSSTWKFQMKMHQIIKCYKIKRWCSSLLLLYEFQIDFIAIATIIIWICIFEVRWIDGLMCAVSSTVVRLKSKLKCFECGK